MKMKLILLTGALIGSLAASGQRKMEFLDRGMVGVKTTGNSVFLSWRLLGTDDFDTAFAIYRKEGNGKQKKLNTSPLIKGTNFLDDHVDLNQDVTYILDIVAGGKEKEVAKLTLSKDQKVQQYLNIPLRTPAGYMPGDVSVGDLDGDGTYELIVHQTGVGHDNAHNGITSEPIFQAYKLDGTFLWEINLGKNIREGAHYTQFMVYDLDSDGRAELVCKTADGTKDGLGNVIGEALSTAWMPPKEMEIFFISTSGVRCSDIGPTPNYLARARYTVSSQTAMTSTIPTTMRCSGLSIPRSTMPDCSDCMTSAPSMAPAIVPVPPASEVPPITAAAMV